MINQTQIMMQEKKIIYNTEVVKANPCDYNYAYILIRGNITIACNIGERVAFKTVHYSLSASQKLMEQQ